MNYKVFFAYQSDIPEKFGKRFIIEAMDQTIARMKKEGINIELDYGMRKTPGNPLLIEEMLSKSKNADLVLVDLTFTSSKNWFESKKINFLNKEIRVLNRIEDKLSSNPNALLEMGYAWAQKGYHRTALLMNTEYGTPEDLPVDLRGFRWAIPFSISERNYSEAKIKRKELADDLYNAIKPAISSDAQYQQERLKPILLRRNWRPRDFNTIYRPTDQAKRIIQRLRIDLENKDVPQRLVGPKNSGKTRLAFELYKEIDDDIKFHENHEKVLYYDLDGGDLRSIENKLIDLKELNQRKILILDNCSLKIHNKVFDEYFYDSNVSLLSIGNTEDGAGATYFLDRVFAIETIEKISNEIGNPRNTSFIVEASDGNLRNAIAMIGKIPEGEVGLSEDYQTKWKQILQDVYSEKAVELLENLSLFTHIGISDRFERHSDVLLYDSDIDSKEELSDLIDALVETGIIKLTGDFVILEAFIEELAYGRISRLSSENLDEYMSLIASLNLSKQFSNRLIEIYKIDSGKGLVNQLSQENGLLWNEAFIDSDQGARILMSLAEIEPIKVSKIIYSALFKKSKEELSRFKKGRRYLVWTLERLVYREETFKDAARLLFKLAVSENENIGNNATAQFCQLYQLFLPATTVSLDSRLSLLKELAQEDGIEGKGVIIQALSRALMTRGFTRMGGADKQAGEQLVDYQPKSDQEILKYWESVIELLEELGAYDVLVNKFNSQVHSGNSSAIIDAMERMLSKTGSIDKDLRQQFEYLIEDRRGLSQEIIDRIQLLIDQYTENNIREQLEYKVALAPYSTYKSEKGKIINKSEEKAAEFVSSLMSENNQSWLAELDVLLKDEQRITFMFGKEIAFKNPNYTELVDAVIETLSNIPFENQNNSLIAGYCSGLEDENQIRQIIDRFLANDKIAFHAIQITRSLKVVYSDLEKLINLIDQHPNYIVSLQYLNLQNLSEHELEIFIDWVKEIAPYGWWIAVDLIYTLVEKKESLTDPIVSLIKPLFIKQGALKGQDMHVPFAMHQYVDLFKKVHHQSQDEELISFLTNEIVDASMEISLRHEFHLKDILDILIKDNWDISWSIIGSKILQPDYYGWYNLKDLLKKIKVFNDDKLLVWMDENPDKAPQKAIDFINLVVKDAEKEKWSPLVLKMFDRYYNNDSFLSALSSNLHSYFWSGSLVPLLESRKRLLEQLIDHDKEEIRNFAIENIRYFEEKIQREHRRDANDGIDY